jgi:hypothetical protein
VRINRKASLFHVFLIVSSFKNPMLLSTQSRPERSLAQQFSSRIGLFISWSDRILQKSDRPSERSLACPASLTRQTTSVVMMVTKGYADFDIDREKPLPHSLSFGPFEFIVIEAR